MSSVDQRVVEMKFDNSDFGAKIKTVLDQLSQLAKGLKLDGATKGLEDVDASARKLNLNPLSSAVDNVGSHFSALSVVAISALATIASKATQTATQFVKSFSFGPMQAGLQEFETNMNSIQTILANTSAKGTTLDQVNAALQDLNTYSDKTIYNFSQMARNIGTFTAAGVDLQTSTNAIKGIANLAAVSGSSADQASTAMYQLSQALASGTVKLMDWNSVVNAGMGGEVFQKALKDTARVHGVAIDDIIKKEGSFRDSLQKGWLTSSILTETLSKFTGDLTAEQIKSMGYTDQQAQEILKMGKTATEAATKVKTFSQLIDTLKEAAGSGWTQSFQLILGNFDEARDMFTGANNVLSGLITNSAKARNKVLQDWKDLGGRTALLESIKNVFNALVSVITPIRDAFREIFPAKTGADLAAATKSLQAFTEHLKLGATSSENLKRTFAGVFAIFDIFGTIIRGVIVAFESFYGAIHKSSGSSGILAFTAGIGDVLVAVSAFLRETSFVTDFFFKLGQIVAQPIIILRQFAGVIAGLFSGFKGAGEEVGGAIDVIGKRFAPLAAIGNVIQGVFSKISQAIAGAQYAVVGAMRTMFDAIQNSFSSGSFNHILDVINTALLGGIVLLVKRFMAGGVKVNVGEGLFSQIKDTLGSVTTTLTTMQQSVKADIILKIAAALGILAASLLVLSTIKPEKLAIALGAMTAMFIEMQIAMEQLSKRISLMGSLKLPLIAASLDMVALALLGIAVALKIMSTMSWEEMQKGLMGVATSLTIIAVAMRIMPKGMVLQAAALVILAAALSEIAVAMKLFGTMDYGATAKALVAMGGSLLVIAAAIALMPPTMVLQAAGLVAVGVALNFIATAMKLMGTMDWGSIAKSLVLLAGSLIVLAGGLTAMAFTLPGAAALVVAAAGLLILAPALKLMGSLDWGTILKGLVTLGGLLLVLAVGLTAMIAALPGAVALVVTAGALAILVPVLATLGSLDWGTILKSLAALAGVFIVLGVAGLVLAPLTLTLLGLAAAMVLIGAGLALAGVGALAFATAFAVMVSVGTAGLQVLAGVLATFIAAIPEAVKAFGEGVIEFVKIIGQSGVEMTKAFSAILSSILQAIIDNVPKLAAAFLTLINAGLNVLSQAIPRIAQTAAHIMMSMLSTMNAYIGPIASLALSIISNFINAIAGQLGTVIQSGVNLIISFINGVAAAIRNNSAALGAAGANLATAIIEGMARGLAGGAGVIASKAKDVAKGALDAAKGLLGIHSPSRAFMEVGMYSAQGMALGLDKYAGAVANSASDVGNTAMQSLQSSMSNLSSLFNDSIDVNPVITPVLDLTDVKKNASQLGNLLTAAPISLDTAYLTAKDASLAYQRNQAAAAETPTVTEITQNVNLTQNNISPKALSQADIYRQTRNQLSVAKGALATSAS